MLWLLAQGRTLSEVAAKTGFVQCWLEQLAKRYNQFGPDALGDGCRRYGTTAQLSTLELLGSLRRRLETPLRTAGHGPRPKSRPEYPANSGWSRSIRTAPVTRYGRLAGRSRCRVPRIRPPPAPTRRQPSKVADTLAAEEARHHGCPVTLFCIDERRIGLKPVIRRIWAPRGRWPTALGHHRYEWLYVTAFVAPASSESHWYVGNGVSESLFEALLATFAHETGAGERHTILLLLDGAGWHMAARLHLPDGLRFVYLPPYTPEPQPAEHLWRLVDEPIVTQHVLTLANVQARIKQRLRDLEADPHTLRANILFHWWPQQTKLR